MTNAHWFLLIGGILLARGLTSTILGRSPFTSSIMYLVVGVAAGPIFLNLFHFDPLNQSAQLELLTEIAVLISLFSAGVKMPVPVKLSRWRPPIMLAWVAMSITVGMVAIFASYVLGLPIGAGVLLGAILAPTDPVLATDVQSRHPGDNDHFRFTLTSEAGMNDGSAFPFVMLGMGLLGLHEIGDFGTQWIFLDVLWATSAAIGIGVIGGTALAHLGWMLRGQDPKHEVLDDLVGLGLIAVVYGLSISVNAWGFLTVFFAGVALRQTENKLTSTKRMELERDQAEVQEVELQEPKAASVSVESELPPKISAETLIFEEHLERLSELLLVFLIGGMLSVQFFNWQTITLAAFIFTVARPISVFISLVCTSTTWRLRCMTGWFGVRGIGSIYYLMYAIQHGLPEYIAKQMIQMTLVVVTLSILIHGTSIKPLISRFWSTKK
ncbi:MAG: sodium:proton antiporter [Candidatus Nitrotoga sp.]|nr:sodium:proton antiporter [Candidatus Nitrotoga sp.]